MQKSNVQNVLNYYNTWESKWGYILMLKGIRHFGYYPPGQEHISMKEAQYNMIEKLAQKLDLKPGSYILDAGCGEGLTALYLAEKYGYKILGIDLLEESIRKAKQNIPPHLKERVTFVCADYSAYDFDNNTFDGIYTMETLVHVESYEKTLKSFHKALKPGGKLVLFEYTLTPYEKMTKEQKRIWTMLCETSGMKALLQFTHGSFPKILQNAGFTNIQTENIFEAIRPMMERFYATAKIPYVIIKFLKLEKKFINAFFSVECYRDMVKNKSAQYIISMAQKPVR